MPKLTLESGKIGKEKGIMFYSQCLLSKKGTLRTIWVAAHCLKRVKKDQVAQTNISSSVEKILADEVPVVSYRVLGYLLLGVVRIFSKKVQYLFHDCRHVLVKVKDFAGNKKSNIHIEAVCAPSLSITRPKRLELDTFDLQILEDGSRMNVGPDEDIMLADTWKHVGSGYCLLDKRSMFDKSFLTWIITIKFSGTDSIASFDSRLKNQCETYLFLFDLDVTMTPWINYHCEEDAEHFETCSTAYTPVKDVLSPYTMGNNASASQSHDLTNSEASIEKLRGNYFSLEERLEPMSFCEFDEEPDLDRQCGENQETEIEQMEMCSAKNITVDEQESQDTLKSFAEEQTMDAEQLRPAEVMSSETGMCPSITKDRPISIAEEQTMDAEQLRPTEVMSSGTGMCPSIMKDRPISITVDVSPPSKCPNTSGATTPEFMVVKTPAIREPARVSRKRKCLFDDIIVLPNKVVKENIDDSSDLVCKRRKVPHTHLQTWKAHKIANLPHTFLEPLFPCEFSLELRSLSSKMKVKSPEDVEPVEAPEKIGEIGSPAVQGTPNDTDIAPSTPATCTASSRLHEFRENTSSDTVGPASPFANTESVLSTNEDPEFDIGLITGVTNSSEGGNQETNEWSNRTGLLVNRKLARYLCRTFLNTKKRGGDAVVNLLPVLKRKTKSENARLFYEILALKTAGYIDVKQHAPFEDILILETPKLKECCES